MTEPESVCLVKIKTIVEDMHRRLFGNGQPGKLQEIWNKIEPLGVAQDRFVGALGIISFFLLLFGGTFIVSTFRGR